MLPTPPLSPRQVLFIKGIYWSEDFFEAMPGSYYSRHALGMLCQGLLIYLLMHLGGHYYVQGVGYATIRDLLSWSASDLTNHSGPWQPPPNASSAAAAAATADEDRMSNPTFCLLLFLAKLLSTNLTIGSGASGGIFSPSLFVGATLGAGRDHTLALISPDLR